MRGRKEREGGNEKKKESWADEGPADRATLWQVDREYAEPPAQAHAHADKPLCHVPVPQNAGRSHRLRVPKTPPRDQIAPPARLPPTPKEEVSHSAPRAPTQRGGRITDPCSRPQRYETLPSRNASLVKEVSSLSQPERGQIACPARLLRCATPPDFWVPSPGTKEAARKSMGTRATGTMTRVRHESPQSPKGFLLEKDRRHTSIQVAKKKKKQGNERRGRRADASKSGGREGRMSKAHGSTEGMHRRYRAQRAGPLSTPSHPPRDRKNHRHSAASPIRPTEKRRRRGNTLRLLSVLLRIQMACAPVRGSEDAPAAPDH
ncbi:hypothetical protein C8R47DRAFT_1070504 [Mycena vitilis]|nr:hypothetical protein C8R47DRAFT_1070504 [Mycena vitilis]